MIEQPIEMIDEAALQRLIDNQVSEGRDLEFKRELPGGNDEATREFLADVTAFANAQGGDIIYGLDEANGVAANLPGVEADDHDAAILRLEGKLQTGVNPRLIGARTQWVPLANGRSALVLRIPGSLNAPHRVTYKGGARFFGRNSRGKYELDVHDLRHAFTDAAQLPQQFRQLHAEAIAASQGVEMPFAVEKAPVAVISVAPLGLFREERRIEVARENAVVPVRVGAFSSLDTIDGVLVHAPLNDAGRVGSYALTYRTGRTDSAFVIGGVRRNNGEDWRTCWPATFEHGLQAMTNATQMQLRQHGIEGPWVILVSVYGAKGFRMILGDGYQTALAFRNNVLLGQHIVERIDNEALMPIAEAFWLLFGVHRPKNRALGAER
ncbi:MULTISPECIES: helix-turn-helix domain-containing protein [Sphingomonadales]|uniref:AlbA family DNA-binding domain-containing protein n=1 Tax=Sphingomonadales TaxID=204457 RepID=UPI0008248E9D|nr:MULTISPECIES: ATP-binding protein [Sphingomonadales]MBX9663019.1 ATP-binding protein [Novosphingobium sp.]MBY0621139.1 ATP-binding protein [Sphingomonas ursincola]